jgi:hypothetical protein
MRLTWVDRILRFARPRRTAAADPAEVSGAQGRHRRSRRRASGVTDDRPAAGRVRPALGPEGAGQHVGSGPVEGWPSAAGSRHAAGYGPVSGHGGPAVFDPAVLDPAARRDDPAPVMPGRGTRDRRGIGSGQPAVRAGSARARIREAPEDGTGMAAEVEVRSAQAVTRTRVHWVEEAQAAGVPDTRVTGMVMGGVPRQPAGRARPAWLARLPFAPPHARDWPLAADGRRNCGSIEGILWRQWDEATLPPAEVVEAIDRLAELPEKIKERLADGLDAIFVGPGGVPELDEMTGLRGIRLPSGKASWDACAGAYGGRKIVVGSQPSPTPDVMCHEVGHALDDLDSPPGRWQSDSAEFRRLYDLCQSHLASDFHRQPGGLGRKEFFADAFAAIASRQRPALVDMLSGDTRTALWIMLYFNRRYGI